LRDCEKIHRTSFVNRWGDGQHLELPRHHR
jgi:hypothetical protein